MNARFADWDTALATHLGTNVCRSSIENREAFTEVAEASYQFAASYVKDTGLPVRHDDVATQLEGVLATNGPLREYLSGKKLRQKYWYRYFADLILDRVWKALTDEPSAIAWGGGVCRAFIDKVIEINRQHGMGDSVPDETYLGAVKESADAVKGVVNAKR